MIITPVPLGNELLYPQTKGRSVGLHASDIYGALYQELEPKRFKGGSPDPLRIILGLALERALAEVLAEVWGWQRPDEFKTVEGIAFSPDGLLYRDDGDLVVGETKLTWKGSRDVPRESATSFPSGFDHYMTQVMFYADSLGTPHARLLVYFVNGTGRAPELLAWDIEFTARELQENRSMLLNFGKSKGML